MPSSAGPSSPAAALAEALENSAQVIDKHLQEDRFFPDLSELLSVPSHSKSRVKITSWRKKSDRYQWITRESYQNQTCR
uniref:Uncharacterized protein n=1 Tax=Cynoglossus semilaevis TaxID=244447 RepID=A0A3P8WL30_CYNSE